MTDAAIYQVRQARRSYGDSFRLSIDALEVPEGCTFCLLGPTGAGKSTLLRLLAGLESPDAGEVSFDGHRLNGAVPVAVSRRITMVHQRPLLLSGTVQSNVEYGLRIRRVAKPKLVERMLDLLGLRKFAGQSARNLSGGQIQLVAIARALVIEPQVLLLDEPTANLDPSNVALIERALAEVQAERMTTLIWATHNLFQARRVARHVGILLNGELVEFAPAEQFFNAPSDSRTRAFIEGKMIY